jgi:hypothetical protein
MAPYLSASVKEKSNGTSVSCVASFLTFGFEGAMLVVSEGATVENAAMATDLMEAACHL